MPYGRVMAALYQTPPVGTRPDRPDGGVRPRPHPFRFPPAFPPQGRDLEVAPPRAHEIMENIGFPLVFRCFKDSRAGRPRSGRTGAFLPCSIRRGATWRSHLRKFRDGCAGGSALLPGVRHLAAPLRKGSRRVGVLRSRAHPFRLPPTPEPQGRDLEVAPPKGREIMENIGFFACFPLFPPPRGQDAFLSCDGIKRKVEWGAGE